VSEPERIGDILAGRLDGDGQPRPQPTFSLRILLPECSSEKEFTDKVLGCLEPWFKAEREVTGTHAYGQRVRIDAVLQPLDPPGWLDQGPAFGIEFKQPTGNARDRTRLAAQAVDYTFVDWHGYGRLGVFICTPGIGELLAVGGWRDPDFAMAHLLGQFTVGELCDVRFYGWTLLIHGSHRLWPERDGVREARHRTIKPKVGSR
jgi:hypothetical protein